MNQHQHPELTDLIEIFGPNHQITLTAGEYFRHHPSHTFGTDPENEEFWTIQEGSVWTPAAALSPRIESELWFIQASFYEAIWNDGDLDCVYKDGKLIWNAVDELDSIQNSILTCLEYDSLPELAADIEAAYRLGCNPLPALRKQLDTLPVQIDFRHGAKGGTTADPRKAVLAVVMLEEKYISLEMYDYYATSSAWYEIQRHEDIKIADIQ